MPDLALTPLAGDRRGSAILIVGPSLGTSVRTLWQWCAERLADRFEVVGWDLPGHGKSPLATGPFTIEQLAKSVRELAATLAEGRPCWYAGVSLGGAVGVELALDPGPFRAAAILGSAAKIGDKAAWRERAELIRRAGTSAVASSSAQRWFAPAFPQQHPEIVNALLRTLHQTDAWSYAWACEALAHFDRRRALDDLKIPILVATGAHDPVVTPQAAKAFAADAAAIFKLIPDCGHLPPAEDPSRVAMLLRDFVDGAEGTRPFPTVAIGLHPAAVGSRRSIDER